MGHTAGRTFLVPASGTRSRPSSTRSTQPWTGPRPADRLLSGETHGRDAHDVPRPPRSTRFYCHVDTRGRPFLLRYESPDTADAVVAFYRDAMPRRGWRESTRVSSGLAENYPGALLAFQKSRGRTCLIAVRRGAATGRTLVSIVLTSAQMNLAS